MTSCYDGKPTGDADSIRKGHREFRCYLVFPAKILILPGQRVTILFEDHDGNLWVGTDNRLSRYHEGKFEPVRFSDGKDLGILYELAQDKDGDVWAITHADSNRLIRIHSLRAEDVSKQFPEPVSITENNDGSVIASFADGTVGSIDGGQLKRRLSLSPLHLTSPRLYALAAMSAGTLWGVTADGLLGIKRGVPRLFNTNQGLPCLPMFSAVADQDDDLWLNAVCGLIELPKVQLDAAWANSSYMLHPVLFGVTDGVESGPSTFSPNSTLDAFGRIWFANGTTLQSITPGQISRNPYPPPVHVEVLIADHKDYSLQGHLTLPANTRDIEIDYTALNLRNPEKVEFRYKLIGLDRDWQEAGNRRTAFFSRLRPGAYQFQVIASNDDDVWNMAGDTLHFSEKLVHPSLLS